MSEMIAGNVFDQNGVEVAGALVYIYDKTGGLAELWDDADQIRENPVVTDQYGYWSAFVATDALYALKYFWGGRLRYVETRGLGDFYKGDPGGNVMAVGLAVIIPEIEVPAGTKRVGTTGAASVGIGVAEYVEDSLAPALLADHPLAVFESDNSKIVRLDPGATVVVTPEQMGCPPYIPGINAQPYIDAAIKYVEALGALGIKSAMQMTQEKYEVWPPLRVPDPSGAADQPVVRGEPGNFTGIPFIITRRVEMRAAPAGTTLIRKTNDGSDPAVFANWPVVADNYGYGTFRGGLFGIVPQAVRPTNPDDRACPVMVGNWTFDGGLSLTDDPGLHTSGGKYRITAAGKGWDIYDKAFWYLSEWGTDYVGKLAEVYGYLKVDGFAGETFFGGVMHDGLVVRGGIEVCNSDAGHYDFGAYNTTDITDGVSADFLWAHEVYLGMERFGGWNNWIGHLKIERCTISGSCMGGNYSEDDGARRPNFVIDHLESSYNGTVATGRHIFTLLKNVTVNKVTLTDTAIGIGRSDQAYSCHDVKVGTVDAWADRINNNDPVVFNAAASVSTRDCSVDIINCLRTNYAVANNNTINRPFTMTTNALGDRIFVGRVTGTSILVSQCTGTLASKAVGLGKMQHAYNTSSGFWNAETTSTLANAYSLYQLTTTTSTAGFNQSVTLPVATNYPYGSRIKVLCRSTTAVFNIATTNTTMSRRAILTGNGNMLEFENIQGVWQLAGQANRIVGTSGSVNLQKSAAAIPAGDVSDESTFTVNGARAGMTVRVVPTTVISADALLVGRVTADNTVGIRAQNMNLGGTLAIGSATYRVELEWPN